MRAGLLTNTSPRQRPPHTRLRWSLRAIAYTPSHRCVVVHRRIMLAAVRFDACACSVRCSASGWGVYCNTSTLRGNKSCTRAALIRHRCSPRAQTGRGGAASSAHCYCPRRGMWFRVGEHHPHARTRISGELAANSISSVRPSAATAAGNQLKAEPQAQRAASTCWRLRASSAAGVSML